MTFLGVLTLNRFVGLGPTSTADSDLLRNLRRRQTSPKWGDVDAAEEEVSYLIFGLGAWIVFGAAWYRGLWLLSLRRQWSSASNISKS